MRMCVYIYIYIYIYIFLSASTRLSMRASDHLHPRDHAHTLDIDRGDCVDA